MIDWPTALVVLGILAPITVALIKLMPRNGLRDRSRIERPGEARVCRDHGEALAGIDATMAGVEKSLSKIEATLKALESK
jgi:hypothetical protein